MKNVTYIDRSASYESFTVALTIASQNKNFHDKLEAHVVQNFTRSCYLHDWFSEISNYKHLNSIKTIKAPYPPLGTLLIGCDHLHLFEILKTFKGNKDEPWAHLTPLGWSFLGSRSPREENNKLLFSDSVFKSSDDFLTELVTREFELEHFGLQEKEEKFSKGFSGGPKDPAAWSPSEIRADEKMKVVHNVTLKHFVVSIPWCDDHIHNLQNNFNAVKMRQDRSHTPLYLSRKGVKIEEVDAILNGYVEKGYIESVPKSEIGQGWYLPFFEVVNRHKSTPIRLVFDAKAAYNKISLNSQIEDTPNRLNDLVLTLLNLRRFRYAITGDISEMFLRIKLDPNDKRFHRFYHEGRHFQWTRILFGNKCSPNASQKVLNMLHDLYKNKYPVAAETVKTSCYMDDVADSKRSESELLKLALELPDLLKLADMKICKFYTNSKLVVSKMQRDLLAKEIRFEDKDPFFDSNMVLGMVWDANTDLLAFKVKFVTLEDWKKACNITNWTKRAVLKTTASTFDPLGLISPIIMYPRTIIQELWAEKLDWDDKISDVHSKKWEECLENILKVGLINFNRWIYDCDANLELHVFCDASETAYAATVYSRVISRGGEVLTNLIMAKSRIAPLKNETVARLELVACVIGTRLLNAVNISYKVSQDKIFYYTDSRNALCWINIPSHKAKTYVFNRTAAIQRVTKSTQWAHVKTDQNPADIATRYITTEELSVNKLWFNGPDFLRDPNYKFRCYEKQEGDLTNEGLSELKTSSDSMITPSTLNLLFFQGSNNHSHVETTGNWLWELERVSVGSLYNGLSKLRRKLLIVFSAIERFKGVRKIDDSELMDKVNLYLVKLSQKSSFYNEIDALMKGHNLSSRNVLSKFNPFIDKSGVLRARSRLDNLDYLPEETKRPILLSGTDLITRLIALEVHWRFEHAVSRSLVLSTLHQKFAIIGLTRLVKSISANCTECKKLRARPVEPQMAPLVDRGLPQRAFCDTGIDFAGPFEIVQGRGKIRKHCFVLVLTCLQTRAVHFEPTHDQTTSSVINALTRFSSLRGRPKRIVSDNQTSFKSADRDLKNYVKSFESNVSSIVRAFNFNEDPIVWEFIPPRSPHFGGAWEIMVKAMKRALNVLGRGQHLTDDVFRTILCHAMNIINNRPLLKSYSQDTPQFLTPNSFLVGRTETNLVPVVENPTDTRLGARWRQIETLANSLWKRFITELLPQLGPRTKWKAEFKDLAVGTVVLVIEPGLSRGVWKLGLVVSVTRGRDGFVREAEVKIGNKIYTRPVIKLIPLVDE